jgi:hypothetical protein
MMCDMQAMYLQVILLTTSGIITSISLFLMRKNEVLKMERSIGEIPSTEEWEIGNMTV